ncbi:hypothetical protein [Cellulomonas hominis]
MDQRGFFESAEAGFTPADPSTAGAQVSKARLASWARLATARASRPDLVPTQREYAGSV